MEITVAVNYLGFLDTVISLGLVFSILIGNLSAKHQALPLIQPRYYLNPVALKSLVRIEDDVVGILNKIPKEDLEACSMNLPVYLTKCNQADVYLKGQSRTEKQEAVLENGLLTLKMIHRLVENLLYSVTESSCTHLNQTIEELFYSANLTKPSQKDLEDALDGILTIHFTYGFKPSQMRVGKYGEMDTKVELDFDNCLSLAKKAFSMDAHALAYQWLSEAAKIVDSKAKRDLLNDYWMELIALTNSTDVKHLEREFSGKIQMALKHTKPYNYNDYGGCRGISGTLDFPPENMYCFYQTRFHPYMTISPVKTEVISEDPLVIQYHELFSPSVMEILIKYSDDETWREGTLVQKNISSNNQSDCHRAAAYFETKETMESVLKFKRTMNMVTGLRLADELHSTSIFGHKFYGSLGGHYKIHHDTMKGWNCDFSSSGDRLATMIIYLNDVKMGGYTTFPKLGVYGEPVKNSGLFSFNMDTKGKLDHRVIHTGCPVVFGEKRVLIIGIFENDNVWEFPCSAK